MISAAQADDKPILIGFAIAQTGYQLPFDTGYKTAEIAIEEMNAKGGLLGRKLVTAYCDTKSDREQGAKCGQEMVEKGADLVVVSCDYDLGARPRWSLRARAKSLGRCAPGIRKWACRASARWLLAAGRRLSYRALP